MLETKKFQELEMVELLADLPEYDLKKGEIGVVVEVFDTPSEAYDLEFVDESGRSSRFAYSVRPDQIKASEERKRKANLFDVVEVAEDITEYGVKRGERGTVVEVLDDPSEAYILEFVDENGSSRLAYWVKPNQFRTSAEASRELLLRGVELHNQGNRTGAERLLCDAVRLDPTSIAELHNLIVRSFGVSDNWAAFIAELNFVLRLNKDYQPARDNLAIAYLNWGLQEQAQGDFDRGSLFYHMAFGVGPSQAIVLNLKRHLASLETMRGIESHKKGQFELSRTFMLKACAADPTDDARFNLGLAYMFLALSHVEENNIELAIHNFERAEETGLLIPELLNDYGVVLAKANRRGEAARVLERALELTPQDKVIQRNLALAEADTGEGLSIVERAREFRPISSPEPQAWGLTAG